jgi:hypothetical protein
LWKEGRFTSLVLGDLVHLVMPAFLAESAPRLRYVHHLGSCWDWSALNARPGNSCRSRDANILSLEETRRGRDKWSSSRCPPLLAADTVDDEDSFILYHGVSCDSCGLVWIKTV